MASQLKATPPAVPPPKDSVVISNTVKIKADQPRNRCANDFLPAFTDSISDILVCDSLAALGQKYKIVKRRKNRFIKNATTISNTEIASSLTFRVDKESTPNKESAESKDPESKLKDVFVDPEASVVLHPKEDSESTSATLKIVDRPPDELLKIDTFSNKPFTQITKELNTLNDAKHLDHLFRFYHPDYDYSLSAEKNIVHREIPPLWVKDFGKRIYVETRDLHMGTGNSNLEPFFCTLSLYDLKNGRRISEYFHFDLNQESILTSTLSVSRLAADPITLSRRCLFSVSSGTTHELVCLVLRIEKVLQGDPDDAANIYLTNKPRNTSDFEKHSKNTRAISNRLAQFRQIFAYGILPLFEYTGALAATGELVMDRLYYQRDGMDEDDFIKCLKVALEDTQRKGKIIREAFFTCSINMMEENSLPANRVDPSFIPLKDTDNIYDLPELENSSIHVKEIEEFPIVPIPLPHSHFVNNLYINPLSCNIKSRGRNISCKVELRVQDNELDSEGIKTIFGKSSCSVFSSAAFSSISYHVSSPSFQDEVKIMLPFGLSSLTHLFLTFYHVSCQHKQGKQNYEVCGYAVLSLYPNRTLAANGVYTLSVYPSLSKTKYLSTIPLEKDSNGTCSVSIRAVTTVFNQDKAISNIFNQFPTDEAIATAVSNKQIALTIVRELRDANPFYMVNFLCPLLNHLFLLLASRTDDVQQMVFSAINNLIDRISTYLGEQDRCSVLMAYITYIFDNPVVGNVSVPIYLNVAANWLLAVDEYQRSESNPDSQLAISTGWFWLELMFKSMVLEKKGSSVEVSQIDEQHKQFVSIFEQFLDIVGNAMLHYKIGGYIALKRLNYNLASFFTDLFCIMRKSMVINLINVYQSELSVKSDSGTTVNDPTVLDMKFTFFTILIDNDYFIEISAPKTFTEDMVSQGDDLIVNIAHRYPITGLLISEIGSNIAWPNEAGQFIVIDCLRNILIKHDFDDRCTQNPELLTQLATMYLPLLSMILDKINIVSSIKTVYLRRNILISCLWVLRHASRWTVVRWIKNLDEEHLSFFMDLLNLFSTSFNYIGFSIHQNEKVVTSILSNESITSFLFDQNALPSAGTMSVSDVKADIEEQFSSIHQLSKSIRMSRASTITQANQPVGTSSVRASAASVSTGTGLSLRQMRAQMAQQGTLSKAQGLGSVSTTSTFGSIRAGFGTMRRTRKETNTGSTTISRSVKNADDIIKLCRWEAILCESVGRTVLKNLLFLLQYVGEKLTIPVTGEIHIKCPTSPNIQSQLIQSIFNLILSLLNSHMSDSFYMSLYPIVRVFLHSFGCYLFSLELEDSFNTFIHHLILHCTYSLNELRAFSTALIYSAAEFNLRSVKTLELIQIGITIGLSDVINMLKESERSLSYSFLKQSLDVLHLTMLRSMSKDISTTSFKQLWSSLLGRAKTILADSLEINRQESLGAHADPALLEDLYMQMADAHNHLPDVRITWLSKLAEHNSRHENYAEAGQCYLQIATLVHNLEIAEKKKNEVVSKKYKSARSFNSQAKIISNLYLACTALDQAELYEQCNQTYHKLIPIYEEKRSYADLSKSYRHLSEVFDKLLVAEEKQSRMLGTYYRICFYGTDFGLQNGIEYVYKLPKITRLPEVVNRFKQLYSTQLKKDVKILSSASTPTDLDPNEPTIVITYIEPDFSIEEEKSRVLYIEKNSNLKKFKFSTPFTKSGKTHGDITQQYKRNVSIDVGASFPYLKTRQRVIKKVEVELEPIEAATEDIVKRTKFLANLLSVDKIETKNLTNFLQGSILLQVNGGTKEVCEKFLNDEMIKTIKESSIKAMQKALSDFLEVCQRGLEANGNLTKTEDEKKLQDAMETEFSNMRVSINTMIHPVKEKKKKIIKGVRFANMPVIAPH